MRAPSTELPVVFDAVCVSLGANRILSDVDLTLRAGAPSFVVGPNGSGKSTLLRVAIGLVAPSAGRVSWGGMSDPAPRRRAMLFQRPVMLRRSVAANVAYALRQAGCARGEVSQRVDHLLERVGLSGFANRAARNLSGGEQQKLALARSLARDPEVLLLDEPTANLDPSATRAVEDIIAGAAAAGIKIVVASHDLGQVRRLAGEVHLLVAGRLRESASVSDFFDRPKTPQAQAFLRSDIVLE